MPDAPWYESFFTGVVLDFWRAAASPAQTRAEADFLERALRLRPASRLLDVPCGPGRHSLELAARGHRMTGVDYSQQAIDIARGEAARSRAPVEWVKAEMRDLSWREEFDAAFCFGNSFGFLDPGGTRAFLTAVSTTLRPGARFAVDYGMAAESILPRLREREWAEVGGILFLEENRYDVAESRIETTYTFVRGGVTDRRTGLHWVYTVREVRSFLEEAGLAPQEILGSLDGTPFQPGGPYLIAVAQKR